MFIKKFCSYFVLSVLFSVCLLGLEKQSYADIYQRTLYFAKIVDRGDLKTAKAFIKEGIDINYQEKGSKLTFLLLAVAKKNYEMVKLLLKNGANPNTVEKDGVSPLLFAVTLKEYKIAKLLIQYKANINYKTQQAASALFMATHKKNYKMVKLLLKNGANPNMKGPFKSLLLLKAYADIKMLKLLLSSKKTNINAQNLFGRTLLLTAIANNNLTVVKLALDHKANINLGDNMWKSPLIFAVLNKNTQIVKYLLSKGAKINAQDREGYSALMHAVKENNTDLVKILITAGAKDIYETKNNENALLMAAKAKNFEIVQLLIKKAGSKLEQTDKLGNTLLILACAANNSNFAKYLIEHNANVNAQNELARSPLSHATRNKNEELVKLLLLKGAKINFRCASEAAYNGSVSILELFFKKGFNLHTLQGKSSLLMVAAEASQLSTVLFLLEHKLLVNLQDESGKTAFIYAMHKPKLPVIKALIQAGANLKLKDKNDKDALDYISEYNNPKVFKYLEKFYDE